MREIGGPESIFFFWVVKKESGSLERESTLLLRDSFYRGREKNIRERKSLRRKKTRGELMDFEGFLEKERS